RNIRLAEAPSFGKPALFHDRESRGALAYLALAGEMIRREEGTAQLRGASGARVPAAGGAEAAGELAGVAPAVVPPAGAAPGEEIH
ncbi:MAG TPA: hypothetical protein VGF35_02695, partial [Steroidobacteraceae bacterium]